MFYTDLQFPNQINTPDKYCINISVPTKLSLFSTSLYHELVHLDMMARSSLHDSAALILEDDQIIVFHSRGI